MKWVSPAVLLAALVSVSPNASADTTLAAPKASLIAVMRNVGQALVFDKNQGAYVVVRRGDAVQGFSVVDIDDDQLVLESPAPQGEHGRYFVLPLAADSHKVLGGVEHAPAAVPPAAAAPAPAEPAGPTAVSMQQDLTVLDPYTVDLEVVDPYVEPTNVVSAAPTAAPATPPAIVDQTADLLPAPTPAATPTPTVTPTPASGESMISRNEFESSLMDFDAVSKEVKLALEPRGVRIVAMSSGSLFDRLGLRKGDLVLEVAGIPIRSTDDAAAVYVALSSADSFEVRLLRDSKKRTLHIRFTP